MYVPIYVRSKVEGQVSTNHSILLDVCKSFVTDIFCVQIVLKRVGRKGYECTMGLSTSTKPTEIGQKSFENLVNQ